MFEVHRLDGVLITELAYGAEWDLEHTLGLRYPGGTFVGLCGSVLLK